MADRVLTLLLQWKIYSIGGSGCPSDTYYYIETKLQAVSLKLYKPRLYEKLCKRSRMLFAGCSSNVKNSITQWYSDFKISDISRSWHH